jgi:hypothetical protein
MDKRNDLWRKASAGLFANASYDPSVDGLSLEELAREMGCSEADAEESYLKHCDAGTRPEREANALKARALLQAAVDALGAFEHGYGDAIQDALGDEGSGSEEAMKARGEAVAAALSSASEASALLTELSADFGG